MSYPAIRKPWEPIDLWKGHSWNNLSSYRIKNDNIEEKITNLEKRIEEIEKKIEEILAVLNFIKNLLIKKGIRELGDVL